MAGRILPVALATIGGISIAVATFKPELEAQQKRRLEEEYQRDLAAAAASATTTQTQGIVPQRRDNLLREEIQPMSQASQENQRSKLSSLFGLWAWQKSGNEKSSSGSSTEAEQSKR